MKRKFISFVLLVALLAIPAAALSSDFDTLVVFGDSLSDNGNLYAVSPDSVPAVYYYQGRFSNGRVWAEYLAGSGFLDCTLDDRAWGGAETDSTNPPGLLNQVEDFVTTETLPANALFAIWCGANDFLGGGTDVAGSVANIASAMNDLADFGAQEMMVVNLPDLGATPRLVGTVDEAGATALSENFNATLATAITAFRLAHLNVRVYEIDSYAFLNAIIADPAAYGFTNATDVCPAYATENDFDNSAGYVFWDDIHPTTETHRLLAEQVLSRLPDDDDDGGSGGCFIGALARP